MVVGMMSLCGELSFTQDSDYLQTNDMSNLFFLIFSLVDLGEENDRNLKMPSEIAADKVAAGGTETVEAAEKATTEMAEQAGEIVHKVNIKKKVTIE